MSDDAGRPRLRGLLRLLPDHAVVPEEDVLAWVEAQALGMANRQHQIALTQVGALRVSTVFLGLDMGPWCFWLEETDPPPPPLGCFETMVFDANGPAGHPVSRYGSWEEALMGHAERVAALQADARPRRPRRPRPRE